MEHLDKAQVWSNDLMYKLKEHNESMTYSQKKNRNNIKIWEIKINKNIKNILPNIALGAARYSELKQNSYLEQVEAFGFL